MSFILTGVQHKKTGDEIIPSKKYETKDAYMQEYFTEMANAMGDDEFLGLGIKVFESGTLKDVLTENWIRQTDEIVEEAE